MIETPSILQPLASSIASFAATLAAAYDRCVGAIDGSGVAEPACLRFAAQLAEHWRPDGPAAPPRPPDAVSDGRGGVPAMRWYAVDGFVRGYPTGARGCYMVPLAGAPPGL